MSIAPELPPPTVARRRRATDRTVVPLRRGRQAAPAESALETSGRDGAPAGPRRSGARAVTPSRAVHSPPRPLAAVRPAPWPPATGADGGHGVRPAGRPAGSALPARTGAGGGHGVPPAGRPAGSALPARIGPQPASPIPAPAASPPAHRLGLRRPGLCWPAGGPAAAPAGGPPAATWVPVGAGAGPGDAPRPDRTPVVPVRLTRLGRAVLGLAGILLGLAILVGPTVAAARLGRPVPALPSSAPAVVVVQPGETLWTIARRVAPERDPRDVVTELRRRNALPSADVRAGQRLRLRDP